VIAIRRARPADADAIGEAHVAVWRSTYAGILPEDYLASMSASRQAAQWRRLLAFPAAGHAVFVAVATGPDSPDLDSGAPRVVGFASGGRARSGVREAGEIETLYLLEDWRERGVGRRLMRALAAHLNAIGCRSVMLWVLKDNPSRWFYQHLGGRPVAEQIIRFAGEPVMQLGLLWEPITVLLAATAPTADQ
jgi:ribosomal protein S18 acetylase RimI-like enzyme